MDPFTQHCPLCAEDLSRTATICPYCSAKFSVSSTGYCTTCHTIREADNAGLCKACGNPVADRRVESKLIEDTAPSPTLPAGAASIGASGVGTQSADMKAPSRAWLYAGIGDYLYKSEHTKFRECCNVPKGP